MRTILYAVTSPAGQTLARQCEQAESAGFRLDDVVAEEMGASAQAPLATRPEGKRLLDALRAGDTLVVDRVDRLGRTYAEVSDALRCLVERGVTVKSIVDETTFDGGAKTPMQQAARDALIAFAAAQAQTEAKREEYRIRRTIMRASDSRWDSMFNRETARLQARISVALIAAMAAGVYVIGFILPLSPRHPSPMMQAQIEASSRTSPRVEAQRSGGLPPSARQERDEEPTIVAQNQTRSDPMPAQSETQRSAEELASLRYPARPQAEQRRDDEAELAQGRLAMSSGSLAEVRPEPAKPASDKTPADEPLPRFEEQKIRQTVIEWRSARVSRPDFEVSVGNIVPRRIHLANFPRHLVAEIPRYRGYKFIVAENRIAVVDPETYRIVAVIGE